MHSHGVCHLDLSLRNILTDGAGRCAIIDFELSRRLQRGQDVRICGRLGTEIPKELDRGEQADPFKIDVYALGAVISRACQVRVRALDLCFTLTLSYLSGTLSSQGITCPS